MNSGKTGKFTLSNQRSSRNGASQCGEPSCTESTRTKRTSLIVRRLGNTLHVFSHDVEVGDTVVIDRDGELNPDKCTVTQVLGVFILYVVPGLYWTIAHIHYVYKHVGRLSRKITWLRDGDVLDWNDVEIHTSLWNFLTGRKIIRFRE